MSAASTFMVDPDSPSTSNLDPEAPKKKPRRIIHFSDGILEEYSEDEDTNAVKTHASCPNSTKTSKEPRFMNWPQYITFQFFNAGTKSLAFCDYLGEKFAWMLGITSPKYQYAIEERERKIKEEKEDQEREGREAAAKHKRENQNDPGFAMDLKSGINLNQDSDILQTETVKF